MELPTEIWRYVIDFAIHSLREDYEKRAREWEEQAHKIDENTPADLLKKLIVTNPADTQTIQKDLFLPENTIIHMKRINWQLCQLVSSTEEWWRRIFGSFYNTETWYNISRFTNYQEALNTLKKVSNSAKRQRDKSSLQPLNLPFEYDKLCLIKEGQLYYVYQGQILSRCLADLSSSPSLICKCPMTWLAADILITNVFILNHNWIALEILEPDRQEPITSFVNNEGEEFMQTVQTICYYEEDLAMLEWWDERKVIKLSDLTRTYITINLTPLKNTRIFCDWANVDGILGYLSRTTGNFVPVTTVSQRTVSQMFKQHPVDEALEARLNDDMTNKFLFYHMNQNTNVFVHDVYAQESSFALEVCGVKWAESKSKTDLVQNVALVKNRLIILMRSKKEGATNSQMSIWFVDIE